MTGTAGAAETDRVHEGVAERAARWLAARSTRRSFLGRFGRGAVLVASGSTIATLIGSDPASARVCGQSGVAAKCPNYDCSDTWGWCWYATGCCAGGGLKKICDCCAPVNNVHGYCPSGTNVKCIVESCGNDPRVQTVPTTRLQLDDVVLLSAAASRSRFSAGGAARVMLVNARDPLVASVAAPLAAALDIPLLVADHDRLRSALVAELQRLGTRDAVLFGRGLSPAVAADLGRYGISSTRDGEGEDLAALSLDVADRLRGRGATRAWCVEAAGVSAAAAPMVAAAAAAHRQPLLIGVDAAKQHAATLSYVVGPEAAARAGELPGGHPMRSHLVHELTVEIAEAAAVAGADVASVGLFPGDRSELALGLLTWGAPMLAHIPGTLAGARDWMFRRRDRFRRVAIAGRHGALDNDGYYEVQSLVNGFEAHLLIGVAGQGLPVIEQPLSERPIGRARVATAPPPDNRGGAYWTGRVALEAGE